MGGTIARITAIGRGRHCAGSEFTTGHKKTIVEAAGCDHDGVYASFCEHVASDEMQKPGAVASHGTASTAHTRSFWNVLSCPTSPATTTLVACERPGPVQSVGAFEELVNTASSSQPDGG